MPGRPVEPLRVRVADGRWAVQGATVTFRVVEGGGSVSPSTVVTAGDGVAQTEWTLGTDRTKPRQQVLAELHAAGATSAVVHAGLTFNANLSLAEEVAYTPAVDCSDLSGAATVGEALDMLCRREGGGDCTYTIRDGEDLVARWAEIEAAGFDSGAICFAEGRGSSTSHFGSTAAAT